MRIEQSFEVEAPLDAVWAEIRDPERMVICVPGCESIEALDETTYRAVVGLSVGPIRARFNLTVAVEEERPPLYARTTTTGEEGSRASMVRAVNEVHLEDLGDARTRIAYSSEVEISGRLGRYGGGMMKKIAERKAREFEEAFRARVEAQEEA
jgi:carbon monoxide dehydrogenase subunit G